MLRRTTVSALFVAGLFAVAAGGQPPDEGSDPSQPSKGKKQILGETMRPADPGDAAMKSALANDPDVLVARAKVQLAEAELTKAKQGVVLKVMTLKATLQENRSAYHQAQERLKWAERMVKNGVMEERQLLDERGKLESAQAALARAETELKLLTGGGDKEFRVEVIADGQATTVARALEALMSRSVERDQASTLLSMMAERYAVKGPIPDRIRAALDKPVKLGAKGDRVTFEKAMEVFKKDAGLDVPVRGPGDILESPFITSQGEELPVGAWLQLFQDYAPRGTGRFYVRDYGLLYTDKTMAPPDAPTITEFWKQKPEAKKEAAPGPGK
jgi:hypothetical protein